MADEIIVVDTNIIIDFVKKGDKTLEEYLKLQKRSRIKLYLSMITVFEYFSGIDINKKDLYQESEKLFERFYIQELNETIAKIAASLNFQKKLYRYIDTSDILIAATCLYLDAFLLTKNQKHFKLIPNLKFVSLKV
jgi:Predicted nucleic acid-binding protein, contains PIN domain